MSQVVSGLFNVVLDLNIIIHDLVLKRKVLQRLYHLLYFSTDFGCVFVFKLLNGIRDSLEVLTQVLIDDFTAPVPVTGKELANILHILY